MDGDDYTQYHSKQGDKIPLRQYMYEQEQERKGSTANVDYFQPSKIRISIRPILMIILTTMLTISLLFVYLTAEGKQLDHTIMGLRITSLISLLLAINAIIISSGISMSIAEYKWVHLTNGTQLTLIDIYDICSRGLGGFLDCIWHLQFDIVLLIMLILHLGLLVISPASLELIIPCSSNITIANEDVQIYVNQPYLYLPNKLIPPNISGLKTYGHIASYSFSLASMHLQPPSISHVCPDYANSCTFKDIQFISTSFACKEVTENEPILDKNYNYSTISHYLQQSTSGFPHFFFAGDMHQRTSHDLYDYTLPITSEEIATILSNTTYDTYYRHYVGEQAFVMAYSSKGINVDTAQKSDIIYQKCHFTSRINNSTWQTKNGVLTNIAEESIPIEMDYDGIIGNNSALNSQTKEIAIMVNAYSMQQSLLNELVLPNYSNMKEYLTRYLPISPSEVTFQDYLNNILNRFDILALQMSSSGSGMNLIQGEAVVTLPPVYKINKIGCYLLSFSLFIPSIIWVIVWIISMKRMHSIARGSSNISLLAINITPLAEHTIRNFSKLDSETIFKRAKNIRMKLASTVDNIEERLTVTMEGESVDSMKSRY